MRATFLFVQAEDETENAVGTWGGQHAALSAALDVVGRGEVLVVGRDPARLAVAGRVLDKWAATPPESVMMSYDTAAAELTAIKKAIAASDWGALGASAAAARVRRDEPGPAPCPRRSVGLPSRTGRQIRTQLRAEGDNQLSPVAADGWIAARWRRTRRIRQARLKDRFWEREVASRGDAAAMPDGWRQCPTIAGRLLPGTSPGRIASSSRSGTATGVPSSVVLGRVLFKHSGLGGRVKTGH